MRPVVTTALVFLLVPVVVGAQVLRVSELSVRDLSALDRERTVVVIPGGLLEEHGPYLPSFTDGYLSEWIAERTAEALVAERGRTVLMLPTIPLGVGSPEDFAGLQPFSGSYTVRPETLRAVYMDLAAALGRDGFRTIFIVNGHGSPSHNWALTEASRYFEGRFGGTMVPLLSLVYRGTQPANPVFSPQEAAENGVDVHSGATETSRTLFLRPRMVHSDYVSAPARTAGSPDELLEIARQQEWTGYFGSPRISSAQAGAQLVDQRTRNAIELAVAVLDGLDWHSLSSLGDRKGLNRAFQTLDENLLARSSEEERMQSEWIRSRR